jgi:hypothetical protein
MKEIENVIKIGTENNVAFRFATVRNFRGAKGEIPAVIDLSVFSPFLRLPNEGRMAGKEML